MEISKDSQNTAEIDPGFSNNHLKSNSKWRVAKRTLDPKVRQALREGKTLGKYSSRSEVSSCMVCDKVFGIFNRRRQCKSCGCIACSSCLSKKIFSNETQKKITVCDQCFQSDSLSQTKSDSKEEKSRKSSGLTFSNTIGAVGMGAVKGVGAVGKGVGKGVGAVGKGVGAGVGVVGKGVGAGVGVVGKGVGAVGSVGMGAVGAVGKGMGSLVSMGGSDKAVSQTEFSRSHRVPWYLYFTKPFSTIGSRLEVGRVYVKVLEARNLPKMDTFGLTDAFVKIRIDASEFVTPVIPKNLNPKWDNAEYVLSSTHGSDILELACYDADQLTSTLIGKISIPLPSISHGIHFQQWYDLSLEDKVQKKVLSKRKSSMVKQKKGSSEDETVGTQRLEVIENPQLLLEISYEFSKVGEFFSYFVPKPAPVVVEPEFQITKLRDVSFRLLEQCSPIFFVLFELLDVLFWVDTLKSVVVTTILLLCSVYPWIIPVILCGILLTHMSLEYINHETSKNLGIVVKEKKSIFKRWKNSIQTESVSSEVIEKESGGLSDSKDGILMSLASRAVAITGIRPTLRIVQNQLFFVCDIIDMLYALLSWKDYEQSKMVFFAISALMVYSIFLNFKWIIFVGVLYVFTMFSKGGIILERTVFGFVDYFSRPLPKTKPQQMAISGAIAQKKIQDSINTDSEDTSYNSDAH